MQIKSYIELVKTKNKTARSYWRSSVSHLIEIRHEIYKSNDSYRQTNITF
jgi:hypothetical protein